MKSNRANKMQLGPPIITEFLPVPQAIGGTLWTVTQPSLLFYGGQQITNRRKKTWHKISD